MKYRIQPETKQLEISATFMDGGKIYRIHDYVSGNTNFLPQSVKPEEIAYSIYERLESGGDSFLDEFKTLEEAQRRAEEIEWFYPDLTTVMN